MSDDKNNLIPLTFNAPGGADAFDFVFYFPGKEITLTNFSIDPKAIIDIQKIGGYLNVVTGDTTLSLMLKGCIAIVYTKHYDHKK